MIRAALLLGGCLFLHAAAVRAQEDGFELETKARRQADRGETPQEVRYSLERLTSESLRSHASVSAASHNLEAARQQLTEARRAWWPSFTLEGLVAPSVDIHCAAVGSDIKKEYCLEADVKNPVQAYPTGVLTRWEIRMGFPLYTFGKLTAVGKAAEEGVHFAERGTEIVRAELALNVARAYYGAKVARELLEMVGEGLERLGKAVKQVEEDLDKGKGRSTETDRLRLRVAQSLVEARSLEAEKGERLAIAALRTLIPTLPAKFDLDADLLEPVKTGNHPADYYVEAAMVHRPEARIANHAVDAAGAGKSLAKAGLLPDLLLVGSYFRLWKTTDNDDPSGPYMLRPFAAYGYGGALVLRWELDLHLKIPRYLRASETFNAATMGKVAALDGMKLEVRTAYENMLEAGKRIDLLKKAEQAAHSWLTAVAQNFAIGTAEAREFNDALFAYFDAHGRYLQSIYDYNVAASVLTRLVGVSVAP